MVSSLAELKRLVSVIRCPEVRITVWRSRKKVEFESGEYKPIEDELRWFYFHTDEVMYFSSQKNRNWSESYEKNPKKYRKEVEEWSK
jgi:hypothetical protein